MGKARTMLNLIIVFFVTGLWHGASWNFIVWGMLHGFFIILERTIWGKIIAAACRPFKHMYTLLIVIVAWVFFRAEHLSHAVAYLKVMFSWQIGDPILSSYLSYFHLNAFNICCALTGILAATPLASYVGQGNETRWRRTLKSLLILMSFILSIMFLNAGNHNPFIYFRF
jgi:alginate O-acetyltransferase complex protein AlgI